MSPQVSPCECMRPPKYFIEMPQHSSKIPMADRIIGFFKKSGDAAFLIMVVAVIGFASLWFYWYIYPPIYLPEPAQLQKSTFDIRLYEQVLGRIESNEQHLQEKLNAIPRNPFLDL